MKMPKRVAYPMDEVLDFESQAPRASTWESAGDVVRPNGSNLMDPREIAHVTGLPLYIFSHKQTRDSLGVPHRRVQKLIRFDRDEVMAWARRWLQDAKEPRHRREGRPRRPVPLAAADPASLSA
jgi:hypothetical protein